MSILEPNSEVGRQFELDSLARQLYAGMVSKSHGFLNCQEMAEYAFDAADVFMNVKAARYPKKQERNDG